MLTIGIDPGKSGFVTVLEDGEYVNSYPVPTLKLTKTKKGYDVWCMRAMLAPYAQEGALVVLEKQQPYPGQGGVSNFSLGEGYALWLGLTVGLCIKCVVPHPKTWQKVCHKDITGDNPKTKSIIACGRLFPDVDLRATERCRKPHDGKADSLLIAWYGYNFLNGKDV